MGKTLGEQKTWASRWPNDGQLSSKCVQWPWGNQLVSLLFRSTSHKAGSGAFANPFEMLWSKEFIALQRLSVGVLFPYLSAPFLATPPTKVPVVVVVLSKKNNPESLNIYNTPCIQTNSPLLFHLKFHRNHSWINKITFFPNVGLKDLLAMC